MPSQGQTSGQRQLAEIERYRLAQEALQREQEEEQAKLYPRFYAEKKRREGEQTAR